MLEISQKEFEKLQEYDETNMFSWSIGDLLIDRRIPIKNKKTSLIKVNNIIKEDNSSNMMHFVEIPCLIFDYVKTVIEEPNEEEKIEED